MQIFVLWVSSFLAMIALDIVWIGTMVSRLYAPNIGHLMAKDPNLYAAAVFYVLYAVGLTLFVTYPAVNESWSISKIALYAGVFGLVCYGTFDLTNHAIMRDWSLKVTIIDMVWGAVITTLTSLIATRVAAYF